MSYTKTTWETGDVITKQKLNNIENGISDNTGKVMVCNFTNADSSTYVCDKTYAEVEAWIQSGGITIGNISGKFYETNSEKKFPGPLMMSVGEYHAAEGNNASYVIFCMAGFYSPTSKRLKFTYSSSGLVEAWEDLDWH